MLTDPEARYPKFIAATCNPADNHPLWYWCEVANWLHDNHMITEEMLDDAQAIYLINHVLELNHQKQKDKEMMRDFFEHIGSHFDA